MCPGGPLCLICIPGNSEYAVEAHGYYVWNKKIIPFFRHTRKIIVKNHIRLRRKYVCKKCTKLTYRKTKPLSQLK